MKKSLICLLTALAILLSLLSVAVLAAKVPEFSGTCGESIAWELDPITGFLRIDGQGAMPDYSYSDGAPWYACRSRIFRVAISGEITSIGAYAFNECANLVTVDASGCVLDTIGEGAMSGCGALESVTFLPGTNLFVGADAFADCAALTTLNLGAEEGEIDNGGFYGCAALEEITLPANLLALKENTFSGCTALKSLTLPENLVYIGKGCFRNCTALTEISFPETLATIERDAFEDCGPLCLTFAGNAPMFAPASDVTASFPADALLRIPYGTTGWAWPICKGYATEMIYPSLGEVFLDLAENAWYVPSVQHVYFNGHMNGVAEGIFAPNNPMSRAELVTVLYRMAGTPEVTTENPFVDVPEGAYYYDAVRWVQANGIVTGVSSTEFHPFDYVNREQTATILYRYAAHLEMELSQRGSFEGFVDADQISDYARDPMSWCVATGLINGKPGGMLDPFGIATRTEIAKILTVFETCAATEDILAQDRWMDDFVNPGPGPDIDWEDPNYLYAQEILAEINQRRTAIGLSAMEWDDTIYLAAQDRAEELTTENGFSHTRPDGSNYSTVFEEFGIEHNSRNEIIARGYTDAQSLVTAWASTSSSSPVISALVYSTAAVGVYQEPPAEDGTEGRYYYVLLVIG